MKEAGLGNGKYGLPWYCFDPPLNCSPALVGWGCFSLSAWFIPLAILQTTSFPAITPCRQPACPPPLDLAASVAGASSSALRDALRKKKRNGKRRHCGVFFCEWSSEGATPLFQPSNPGGGGGHSVFSSPSRQRTRPPRQRGDGGTGGEEPWLNIEARTRPSPSSSAAAV